MHTTLALSHLALGLATTRAHDVFYDPEPGVAAPYGHHPPALALLVAAFFALTGSATPAVARLVVIACHLGSLILLMGILEHLVSRGAAGLGGLAFATLPMSAYFGRMVNYEPVCLFGVMLALGGWLALRRDGPPNGRARLIGGFAFGGLVDWAAFFFAGALVLAEVPDAWRGRRGSRLVVISVSATAALIMALNLWHLWWANRGSLAPLWEVVPDRSSISACSSSWRAPSRPSGCTSRTPACSRASRSSAASSIAEPPSLGCWKVPIPRALYL
jgi:4-amino-4-deoxy-L-arabinose transferase-like glycosyltransferase